MPIGLYPARFTPSGSPSPALAAGARGDDGGCERKTEMSVQKIKSLLENLAWPEGLQPRTIYERLHDDTDGEDEGHLRIVIGDDGDAWVSIPDVRPGEGLRFRTYQGGGCSLRTRAALLILAKAIELDNEERPCR
jgi:hypothetical protein